MTTSQMFFPTVVTSRGPSSQSYGFSTKHVWMWELDYKESWVLKNWCLWTVVLRVPWTARRSSGQSILKEISPEYSLERLMLEAETPILWPPDVKNRLIGKDWRQEEKGTTEDEMVGSHHRLDRHESEQFSWVDDGQGSLVCCSPWGRKELDTVERLSLSLLGFSAGSVVKNLSACRRPEFNPWVGKIP